MFRFSSMTIRARVLAGFLILLALSIGLSVYNLFGFRQISGSVRNIEYSALFTTLEAQHRKWNAGLAQIFLDPSLKELKIQLDHTQCRMGRFIYGEEAQEFKQHFPELAPLIDQLEPVHKDLHASAKDIGPLWFSGEVAKQEQAQQIYQNRTLKALDRIAALLGEMSQRLEAVAKGAAANLASVIQERLVVSAVLLALVVGLGLALAYWISTSIGKGLTLLMKRLDQSAESLNQASDEISGNSQQVAQGASEQAASLEETSSAMEQLAAQSKENSAAAERTFEAVERMKGSLGEANQNADAAFAISAKSREGAQRGVESMGKINAGMKEVDQASQEVMEIIDLIDEITRETKMLATNAAIEAARAGEQGKGFAVVADEVSKLAENSKAAAKQINDLVKGNAAKAVSARKLADEGEATLREIFDSSQEAEKLVQNISQRTTKLSQEAVDLANLAQQITRTSNQQSQGTGEVSRAILEMDQVTQGNASAAEQAASSAEALHGQARQLMQVISDMAVMVGVSNTSPAPQAPSQREPAEMLQAEALPGPRGRRPKGSSPTDFGDF